MKPSALRIERLLAKVEAESRARPRRYCFHFDEVAEAEAQGLPYVLCLKSKSQRQSAATLKALGISLRYNLAASP
jgi:hypothetical protein